MRGENQMYDDLPEDVLMLMNLRQFRETLRDSEATLRDWYEQDNWIPQEVIDKHCGIVGAMAFLAGELFYLSGRAN
jgi:hypothetical protein